MQASKQQMGSCCVYGAQVCCVDDLLQLLFEVQQQLPQAGPADGITITLHTSDSPAAGEQAPAEAHRTAGWIKHKPYMDRHQLSPAAQHSMRTIPIHLKVLNSLNPLECVEITVNGLQLLPGCTQSLHVRTALLWTWVYADPLCLVLLCEQQQYEVTSEGSISDRSSRSAVAAAKLLLAAGVQVGVEYVNHMAAYYVNHMAAY